MGVLSRKRPQAPAKLLGQIQRVCEWKSFLKKVFYRGLRKRVSITIEGCGSGGFSPVDRGRTQSSWFECPILRSRRGRPTGTSCQLYPAAGNSHVSSPVRVFGIKNSRQRWEFQIGVCRCVRIEWLSCKTGRLIHRKRSPFPHQGRLFIGNDS